MRFYASILASTAVHVGLAGWMTLAPPTAAREVDFTELSWAPAPAPEPEAAPESEPPTIPAPAEPETVVGESLPPDALRAAAEALDRFEMLHRRVQSVLERTQPREDPSPTFVAGEEEHGDAEPGNDFATAVRYVEEIVKPRVRAALHVPSRALREDMYGTAAIRMRVLPDGTLGTTAFVQRSPFPLLDDAAHQAVLRAAPLPPPADHGLVRPLDVNCWFEFTRSSASVR